MFSCRAIQWLHGDFNFVRALPQNERPHRSLSRAMGLSYEVEKRQHGLFGVLCQQGGQFVVTTTGPQGSGILRSMSLANCLIDIPEEVERLQPGDTVQIIPL
jgi:molybdopterin biosynthesis enzyme